MDKAVFSLISYRFDQVMLNLENVSFDVSFALNFDLSGEYFQSSGEYKLKFTFKAWEKDINEGEPVVFVGCVASFKFKEAILFDEIPNFFYPNSVAILFPYVRAFVSTLTLQANIKPILLPTLNLSSLQSKLREQTTVIK